MGCLSVGLDVKPGLFALLLLLPRSPAAMWTDLDTPRFLGLSSLPEPQLLLQPQHVIRKNKSLLEFPLWGWLGEPFPLHLFLCQCSRPVFASFIPKQQNLKSRSVPSWAMTVRHKALESSWCTLPMRRAVDLKPH